MGDDVKYGAQEWVDAVAAAEMHDFCPIDSLRESGPMAEWISNEVIDHPKIERNAEIIQSAALALQARGETEFTAERLIAALDSHKGEWWGPSVPDGWTGETVMPIMSVATVTDKLFHLFDTDKW